MKRLSACVLSLVLILSLCACGKSSKENDNVVQSSDKGSRDNPYQIGETITVNGFTAYFNNGERYTDKLFDLELTVNKSYTVAEGKSIRKTRYSTFTAIPAANITFTLTGNYDNEMEYSDIFRVGVLDENMQTDVFTVIEDENQKSQNTVYTGVAYTVNILHAFDTTTETATEPQYFVLYYRGTDGAEKYIYISADAEKAAPVENKDVETTEEKNYQAALAAEEKGYYTIAKNIFGKILDYRDAQEHYNDQLKTLSEYNGTYYGESTQYNNVKIYLYIEDGYVSAQFKGRDKSQSQYELYLYGQRDEDGTPILAFANERTTLFLLNQETSYDDCVEGYAIQQLEDGSYLVGATTTSTAFTWNGFYEKISDSVS